MKHNYVGIDVSAKAFTTTIDHEGKRTEAFDLPNDPKGVKKLIKITDPASGANHGAAAVYPTPSSLSPDCTS